MYTTLLTIIPAHITPSLRKASQPAQRVSLTPRPTLPLKHSYASGFRLRGNLRKFPASVTIAPAKKQFRGFAADGGYWLPYGDRCLTPGPAVEAGDQGRSVDWVLAVALSFLVTCGRV